jgi:hypothetical protein
MATHASHQHYWDDKQEWPHENKEWKHEKKNQVVCGKSLKTIFWKFEKSPWEHYISIYIYIVLILSKLQLQNFHENSPCFNIPFIHLKYLG